MATPFKLSHNLEPKPVHVFPTRHRDKHGKSVSFPIGSEKLSTLLDGVPQHSAIGCHFFVGNLQQRSVKEIEHILHAVYFRQLPTQHFAASANANGVFDPRWSLSVFAVPREFRHAVRQVLEPAITAHLKPWLLANANADAHFGQTAMMFSFNTVDGVLAVQTKESLQPLRA